MNIYSQTLGKAGLSEADELNLLLLLLFSEHPWVLSTVLGVTDVKPHPADVPYPATQDDRVASSVGACALEPNTQGCTETHKHTWRPCLFSQP